MKFKSNEWPRKKAESYMFFILNKYINAFHLFFILHNSKPFYLLPFLNKNKTYLILDFLGPTVNIFNDNKGRNAM